MSSKQRTDRINCVVLFQIDFETEVDGELANPA